MSDYQKNNTEKIEENENQSASDYSNFWLFNKKGTVAEPWPTAKELWNNPKVKKAIDNHNKSLAENKTDQKK